MDGPVTHCKRGHAFSEPNTYWWKGRQNCRTCGALRRRLYRKGTSISTLAERCACGAEKFPRFKRCTECRKKQLEHWKSEHNRKRRVARAVGAYATE